jgi:capsular polysaccharide transport system permease protein
MSATYIHTKHKAGIAQIVGRFFAIAYFCALISSIVYLWFFTQDRYVTIAKFKISSQDSSGAVDGIMSLALPGLSDSGIMDSQVAIGYIDSPDLLLELERDKEFNLIEHYSSPSQDLIFRLDSDSSLEARLKFYRKRIYAYFNSTTGLTEVTVDTFNPELSQKLAKNILIKSEKFINLMNQSIANQQLDFVLREVERTTKKVDDVQKEILTLQNANNFISPNEVISANLKAVETLRMEQLKLEAELSSLLRDSPNSPLIDTIRSQLRSLNELVAIETAKLSGPEKDRLNQLQMEFNQLKLKLQSAITLRTGAEAMMEKNRSTAIAQGRFFSVIQNPFLPESVGIPSRKYATAMIIILGFLLFLILRAVSRSLFSA